MPRKYQRKSNRGRWTEENLRTAINLIQQDHIPIREAGRICNVPERTLRRRMKNNNFEKGVQGPSSYLGQVSEKKVVEHIKALQKAGFPPNVKTVKQIAYTLAQRMGLKCKFNSEKEEAGDHWYRSFMERNPELSLRKAEGLSTARAEGMNRKEVEDYFKLLERIYEANDVFDKPGHVFNVDESGLQLNNVPGKVIAAKGSKEVHTVTSGEKGETITVVACCNSEGNFLPPYCIFKGVNKKNEFEDGMPPGSVVVMNRKSAYVNNELFFDWLKNHFAPRKPQGKTVLILDGHGSHMSVNCLEFAAENDISLVCLPSHTTHYLQPLDRSFFKPLKTFFYQACDQWIKTHQGRRITRMQFGTLLNSAWSRAATAGTAINGFSATGAFPLDPGSIPNHAFSVSDLQLAHAQNIDNENTDNKTCNTQKENAVPNPSLETNVTPQETPNIIIEPQPSTSAECDITPGKVLQQISPVPILSTTTKRRKQSAAHLTSPNYIKDKKGNKTKIKKDKKLKDKPKDKPLPKKLKLKRKKDSSSSSSECNEEMSICSSTDEVSDIDENECVECFEKYCLTQSSADWIQCVRCGYWLHETCSVYKTTCNRCGRHLLKADQVKRKV